MTQYDYEPNEMEADILLSEIPVSLMKENIISQFDDPLEYRKKDHITTFINKYKYAKDNVDAFEDEDYDNLVEIRDDFYAFMQKIFKDYLGIGFVDFSDKSEEDQDNLIHFTYRFFLMNIKKNFVTYIINKIEDNRDYYTEIDDKKKDITSTVFKKEIEDPVDAYIISNLAAIIDGILTSDTTIDDFLEHCDDESTLETRFVTKAYDDMEITGNFIEKYIDMIDSDFKSEIESKIRNKILKKYKKK